MQQSYNLTHAPVDVDRRDLYRRIPFSLNHHVFPYRDPIYVCKALGGHRLGASSEPRGITIPQVAAEVSGRPFRSLSAQSFYPLLGLGPQRIFVQIWRRSRSESTHEGIVHQVVKGR